VNNEALAGWILAEIHVAQRHEKALPLIANCFGFGRWFCFRVIRRFSLT
jgi:hypothetical protein